MARSNSSSPRVVSGAKFFSFSSAALQWIAITTMAIDHIGLYLLNDFIPFRIIGRLAMPLFVFLLVEGFLHTRSRTHYFLRILTFALLAEIPVFVLSILDHIPISHNIMFNLALGLLALTCLERGKGWPFLLFPLAAAAAFLQLDYGPFVVILASAFYLIRHYLPLHSASFRFTSFVALFLIELATAYFSSPLQIFAVFAILPIAFYGGQKGRRLPRYFAYVFYPAHLLLLMFLRLLFY